MSPDSPLVVVPKWAAPTGLSLPTLPGVAGRSSPALPFVTGCHRFLRVSALTRSFLGNSGLCWEWVLKQTPALTPLVWCICKSCSRPSSGKRAPPPPPPNSLRPSCYPAPAPPETLEQLLAQRVRLEAGLGWPGWSSSEAGFQWDPLPLPPWIAVPPDTPQASSSPLTPPTSFPPPEAEVTGSPGLGWGCHHLAVGEEAGPWGLLS